MIRPSFRVIYQPFLGHFCPDRIYQDQFQCLESVESSNFTDGGEFPTSNFHLTFFSKYLSFIFPKMNHEFTASICELLCKIDPHALDHQALVLLSSSFCRKQLIL